MKNAGIGVAGVAATRHGIAALAGGCGRRPLYAPPIAPTASARLAKLPRRHGGVRPQALVRDPGPFFELLPFPAERLFAIRRIKPRHTTCQKVTVQDGAAWGGHDAYRPAIMVRIGHLDTDALSKDLVAGKLPRPGAVGLFRFRAVHAIKADFDLLLLIRQDGDGIPVTDPHNLPFKDLRRPCRNSQQHGQQERSKKAHDYPLLKLVLEPDFRPTLEYFLSKELYFQWIGSLILQNMSDCRTY